LCSVERDERHGKRAADAHQVPAPFTVCRLQQISDLVQTCDPTPKTSQFAMT
jgi:hypothetical protein